MESNDVQVNTSQTIADWKAQNSQRLGEIKSFNPDLYTAINGALSYLNKKYGGEEIVEETVIETKVPLEEPENETPLQTMERILYFGNNEVEISDQDIRKALFSKRKSKQQKLLILKAFGDVIGVDLNGMYGDIFRNSFIQEYENEVGDKQYFRGYRPKQWLKDWDDDLELQLGQNTDLNEEEWIEDLIYPAFENQINMKDEQNLEDLYSLWLTNKPKKIAIHEPNIPQEFTTPNQSFQENDKFITTSQIDVYSLDANRNRLKFNGVALSNVFQVGVKPNRAEYYDFRLKVFQVVDVDTIQYKKKLINSRFMFVQDVYDTRDNSLGWINAITWDSSNDQYVYLVKIQGDLKFIEEKYLSATPITLTTPLTQTTTSTESSEDDEDLGNLLEDLDNFEI